jgi:type II secretory pathway component PulM
MSESAAKPGATNKWAERLRGRSRMAVAVIAGVFVIGFVGVARPLSQRIDTANERLTKAGSRAQLAGEVADLRRQASLYKNKLCRGIDPNDWTDFLLGGIRAQRVRLVKMEPRDPLTLGPCKVLTWNIELEGNLESIGKVVEWLENSPRIVRIDRLVMESPHGGRIGALMVIKGLALDVPLDKSKAAKEITPVTPVKAKTGELQRKPDGK